MSDKVPRNARWSSGTSVLWGGASVVLTLLAFPPYGYHFLGWICLVPLLKALEECEPREGFVLGGLWGLAVESQLLVFAASYGWLAATSLFALRALPRAIFGALAGYFGRSGFGAVLGLASAWTLTEFLGTVGIFGIDWDMLGTLLTQVPQLLQGCSVFGPLWLTFLIALVNAALLQARRDYRPLAATGVLLFGVFLLGQARLAKAPGAVATKVAAVQVSLGQDIKWDEPKREENLKALEQLTREAAERGAQFIVWPETSLPYRDFRSRARLSIKVGGWARELGVTLLVGSIEDEKEGQKNTMSAIGSDGAFFYRHDKVRLAPCAEYLPWTSLRRFALFDRVQRYVPGSEFKPLDWRGYKGGVLICYESMVSWPARLLREKGADFLVVTTNDAPFRDSPAVELHFRSAILRAAELGLPVIQAGNTGISGLIDSRGEVLARSQRDQRCVVVGELPMKKRDTFYARTGDLFVLVCLGLVFLGLWPAMRAGADELQRSR